MNKNVGSVQNFILLFCVWCESREFGSRRSSRFCCITTMVETFSDRVPLKIPMNISYGALLQTYPTTLNLISRCWPFSCSNWHLSSFLSVIYFPFFRRKWIFFVLSFIWHSLNLSISFCRSSEAVVWRCSVENVSLKSTSGACFWKLRYNTLQWAI